MPFSAVPHLHYIWLVAASTIAGVMNAMAGGGSFISFPAMLGMGVLPVQANATNTVALWPGQLTSLATLRGDVRRDVLPTVMITSILGGVAGEEMHRLNALKVVAACASNLCAIFTFVAQGAVEWRFCLVSMVFAAAGGYIGARFARRVNGDVLRAIVVVVGCMIAGYFFFRQYAG